MVFITGDTHGNFRRFTPDNFPEQKNLTKDDYVIICGDFGLWHDTPEEGYWFDWLHGKPFTTLFVDGNHENYDRLNAFPVTEWHGGQVHFVRPSIIHLMRGQVFEIDGSRFFTMGGAASHDIDAGILEYDDPQFDIKRRALDKQMALYRVNHISWWKEEMPSDIEYARAVKTLEANNWQVDYIITHCCPSSISDILGAGHYQPDRLTNFLETVKQRVEFKEWFFGHYHDDRPIGQQFCCLYKAIIELD